MWCHMTTCQTSVLIREHAASLSVSYLVRVAFLFLTLTGILLTFTDPPDRRFQLCVFSWTREIRRETSWSFQNELLINADKVRGEVTSAQSVSAQPTKPVCACWFPLSHGRVNRLETCWMSVSSDMRGPVWKSRQREGPPPAAVSSVDCAGVQHFPWFTYSAK